MNFRFCFKLFYFFNYFFNYCKRRRNSNPAFSLLYTFNPLFCSLFDKIISCTVHVRYHVRVKIY